MATKLNTEIERLLREYKAYEAGPPLGTTSFMCPNSKHDWVLQMQSEVVKKAKLLAFPEGQPTTEFTFLEWYCFCFMSPKDFDYCKKLSEVAVHPHEVFFVHLLTLANIEHWQNRDYKKYADLFQSARMPERYKALPRTNVGEFSRLWKLINHFPTGDNLLGRYGSDWVMSFWKDKCQPVRSWRPYPL